MGFLHIYMKYTQPLFIQAIMTVKGVLEFVYSTPFLVPDDALTSSFLLNRSKPAMLHLYGKKAEGDLARPFKTGGGLLEQFSE